MTLPATSAAEIEEFEQEFVDEVWNGRTYDLIETSHTDDFVGHWFDPARDELDQEELRDFIQSLHNAFSDFTMDVEFMLSDDSMVAVGFSASGTHDGEYMGIPPTNKTARSSGIWVHRYEEGKIAEAWAAWDALGQLQQLGVVPERFTLAAFLEAGATMAKQGVLRRAKPT